MERISLSECRDEFILRGEMLVAAMIGLDAHSAMDIDATIKCTTVQPTIFDGVKLHEGNYKSK